MRDSNPRYPKRVYRISSPAHSVTLPIFLNECANVIIIWQCPKFFNHLICPEHPVQHACRVQQQMQIYGKFSKNLYLGVSKFNFSLGLLFIFFCISIIFRSEKSLKFAFFGMYLLMSLFAFSTAPFCQEE